MEDILEIQVTIKNLIDLIRSLDRDPVLVLNHLKMSFEEKEDFIDTLKNHKRPLFIDKKDIDFLVLESPLIKAILDNLSLLDSKLGLIIDSLKKSKILSDMKLELDCGYGHVPFNERIQTSISVLESISYRLDDFFKRLNNYNRNKLSNNEYLKTDLYKNFYYYWKIAKIGIFINLEDSIILLNKCIENKNLR